MRKLDFISGSPQLAIFNEGANKTNLGGVLYLIYLIVLLLLAIIYIFDFIKKERYEFDYTLYKTLNAENPLSKDKAMNSMLNTDLDFNIILYKDDPFDESDSLTENKNFLIFDNYIFDHTWIERDEDGFCIISDDDKFIVKENETVQKSVSSTLAVLYRCNGENCTIRKEDKFESYAYYFSLGYRGYILQHQDTKKPIEQLPEENFWIQDYPFLENTNIYFIEWELIEYEEEKGIFAKTYSNVAGKSNTYYGGYYKSYNVFTDDGHVQRLPDTDWKIKDKDGNHFAVLLYVFLMPNYKEYERYSRKKISFLDVLADISALASTVLDLMGLAYGFLYSQNYDNYKIIENILTKKMNININNISNKIEDEDDEKTKVELKADLIDNKTEEKENIDKIDIKENKEVEEKEKKRLTENLELPSPKVYDFLFHELYFKCFGPSSKQALIDSCNDIVAKYTTIENLLYNQIKLEYLWKDYKWNNPQNEIKQKEDLIMNLK